MANTYTWDCRTVDIYPTNQDQASVVHNVHWVITGTSEELDTYDNPFTSLNMGTQALDTSDLAEFVEYADLTNEGLTAWTKEAMGTETVAFIEAGVDAALAQLVAPTSVTMTIA